MIRKKTSILDYKKSPVLRQVALPVPLKDIGTKKLGDIIARMKSSLHEQEDGVAIAAPQIGEGLRIFVVSGRVSAKGKKVAETLAPDMVFINPVFTKLSKSKRLMEEGCLSVRWLYGFVDRHEKASIKALDENGKKFEKGSSGLMAQIFQHEMDHLDGVLFIDKAVNVRDLPPDTQTNEL